MKLDLPIAVGALAFGYLLGRLHAADHIADWCYDLAAAPHRPHSFARAFAEAAGCLLIAASLIARPRRTWNAIREAPVMVLAGIVWALALIAGAAYLAARAIA